MSVYYGFLERQPGTPINDIQLTESSDEPKAVNMFISNDVQAPFVAPESSIKIEPAAQYKSCINLITEDNEVEQQPTPRLNIPDQTQGQTLVKMDQNRRKPTKTYNFVRRSSPKIIQNSSHKDNMYDSNVLYFSPSQNKSTSRSRKQKDLCERLSQPKKRKICV